MLTDIDTANPLELLAGSPEIDIPTGELGWEGPRGRVGDSPVLGSACGAESDVLARAFAVDVCDELELACEGRECEEEEGKGAEGAGEDVVRCGCVCDERQTQRVLRVHC